MNRRDFLKYNMMAASSVVFVDSVLGAVNPALKAESIDAVYKGFLNPPVSSRLFVRWWWNGNRLSKKEILRELDVMKTAGIGGVEINPIAFPQTADPVGYEALTIFEDDWLDMLEVALKGAKERGIICDMIVGSGWPFGGEFLKKQDQTQMVTIGTIDLFDFDPMNLRAGIGIMIREEFREKGYATEALEMLIRYAFEVLHIHQLFCNISGENLASIRIFEKLGFIRCGEKRDWINTGEGWTNELMFQLIP